MLCPCLFVLKEQSESEKGLTELEDKVREEVGKVQDPETGMTFAEMQMITSVKEEEPGTVKVELVPTSPFCPIACKLANDIKTSARTGISGMPNRHLRSLSASQFRTCRMTNK